MKLKDILFVGYFMILIVLFVYILLAVVGLLKLARNEWLGLLFVFLAWKLSLIIADREDK